jgi:acetoin utilization protein AcuB
MPFWRYHPDNMSSDNSVKPIDPTRRSVHVRTQMETSKRAVNHFEADDFETAEAISAYKQQKKQPSKPKLAVRAEQIMSSPVVSVKPDTSLNKARQLVKERRFRHVPVVGQDGKILGVVSDRDLFALSQMDDTQESLEPSIVADIMTKGVLTATPDTNIREVARVLFEERIGCMPIVDDEELVVGMITRSDILRALIKHAPLDLWI